MNTEISPSPSLEIILRALNYPHTLEERFKDRLFFTPQGMAVLGSCIGFIAALWMSGQKEKANIFADDFVRWLEYVCPLNPAAFNIGTRNVQIPGRVCELHCDGCALSFSLKWFVLMEDQSANSAYSGLKVHTFGIWGAKYAYQMNGGLIFHGTNQETFSTVLSSRPTLWSIHT